MNEISAMNAGSDDLRKDTATFKVLVTGAELVPEATELLKKNKIETIYADGYNGADSLAEIARTNSVDAILVRQGKINDQVIFASTRLRVIAKHGSGVDNIDLDAATSRNVPVLRALAANAQSVAELAITLSVTLMKDVGVLNDTVKGGAWPKTKYVGRDLAGATFGVVGFGEIGKRTSKLAQGLGMKTVAYDPFAEDSEGISVSRDLKQILSASDIVSLHCPLSPQTHHLINGVTLKLMKPTAFIVNTSRGAVIDENALLDALKSGTIAGAALDSFEQEPPSADHQFWALPNLIATPHVGGASRSALRNMAVQSAQHIVDVLTGTPYDRRALANQNLA